MMPLLQLNMTYQKQSINCSILVVPVQSRSNSQTNIRSLKTYNVQLSKSGPCFNMLIVFKPVFSTIGKFSFRLQALTKPAAANKLPLSLQLNKFAQTFYKTSKM